MVADTESLSLSGRIVLLTLADLEGRGETPAHTGEITRAARTLLDDVDVSGFTRPSEAEVNRALNHLETESHVDVAETGDTSPVGKGRPRYVIADDTEEILGSLADDDEVDQIAAGVAERTA